MTTTPDLAVKTRAKLEATVEPLQAEAVELDSEIARLEAELAELREARRAVKRVLELLTGEKPVRKPYVRRNGPAPKVALSPQNEQRAIEVLEWLRANKPDEPFTIKDVWSHPDWPLSKESATRLLEWLVDRGYLRLDGYDTSITHGRAPKLFKVI